MNRTTQITVQIARPLGSHTSTTRACAMEFDIATSDLNLG